MIILSMITNATKLYGQNLAIVMLDVLCTTLLPIFYPPNLQDFCSFGKVRHNLIIESWLGCM